MSLRRLYLIPRVAPGDAGPRKPVHSRQHYRQWYEHYSEKALSTNLSAKFPGIPNSTLSLASTYFMARPGRAPQQHGSLAPPPARGFGNCLLAVRTGTSTTLAPDRQSISRFCRDARDAILVRQNTVIKSKNHLLGRIRSNNDFPGVQFDTMKITNNIGYPPRHERLTHRRSPLRSWFRLHPGISPLCTCRAVAHGNQSWDPAGSLARACKYPIHITAPRLSYPP